MGNRWSSMPRQRSNGILEGKSVPMEAMDPNHMDRALRAIYRRLIMLENEYLRRGKGDRMNKIKERVRECYNKAIEDMNERNREIRERNLRWETHIYGRAKKK